MHGAVRYAIYAVTITKLELLRTNDLLPGQVQAFFFLLDSLFLISAAIKLIVRPNKFAITCIRVLRGITTFYIT